MVPGLQAVVNRIEMYGGLIGLTLVGSQAYGLSNKTSDYDLLGVYVAPTSQVLSLGHMQPKQTLHRANQKCPVCKGVVATPEDEETIENLAVCQTCGGTGELPDYTVHEVSKYIELAAGANPTVLEWLYLQPEELGDAGWAHDIIIDNRDAFLSTRIRNTYGGYAKQQLHKKRLREAQGMEGYSPKTRYRDEKHTRHIVRLFIQQRHLLETGEIRPRLNEDEAQLCMDAMSWDADKLEKWMNEQTLELININNNIPPEPDYRTINEILLEIRGL